MYLSVSECIRGHLRVYLDHSLCNNTAARLPSHASPPSRNSQHAARERITDDQSKERGRVDAISLPSTYAAYLDLYSLSHDSSVTVQPQVIRIYFPTEAYPDPGARFSAHA